jgi:riboflavin kinase/FMN adenylyltransferase
MKLLGPTDPLPGSPTHSVVTVGTFDGVHRGHQDVVARVVAAAADQRQPSVVVTFEPHPLEVLNPAAAPLLLTTREEKVEALAETGVDYLLVLPFTQQFAAQSAEEFVDEVLLGRLRMGTLLIGHDHGFGRGREGDVETLRTLGAARRFAVDVVPPVLAPSGDVVSSTLIRRAVSEGDMTAAFAGLGRSYSVSGEVVHGEARGRGLGFPTLNVVPDSPRKLLPADGVYAVEVASSRGQFGGMLNLGGRPTFDDARRTIEAHLFDATGDFYGERVRVSFVERLRDTKRFDSAESLRSQLADDERAARRALTAPAGAGNLNGSTPAPPSTQ